MSSIKWNPHLKLIVSDVDQTVADDFVEAEAGVIQKIEVLLTKGTSMFFVTGGPFNRFKKRISDKIDPKLRYRLLVSHCSGAEVWGFEENGDDRKEPYYSLYDSTLSMEQKKLWRVLVKEIIAQFNLKVCPMKPVEEFKKLTSNDPQAVIVEDRGPQITIEFVNDHSIRDSVVKKAMKMFTDNNIPIIPRLGGVFAVDFALEGANKTKSIEYIIANSRMMEDIGLQKSVLRSPENIEIWGDRFSKTRGTDWLMSVAFPKNVRSIDFREEDKSEFPEGYNIVLWDGQKHLQEGLLEYLQNADL